VCVILGYSRVQFVRSVGNKQQPTHVAGSSSHSEHKSYERTDAAVSYRPTGAVTFLPEDIPRDCYS
jgi:hypothetical protein